MGLQIRGEYPMEWGYIAEGTKIAAGWKCIRCGHKHEPMAGYGLTVHHFNGDKSNCNWWNLMALCQRCHLVIQGRINPEQPYIFKHSEWIRPYVAGFYAWKYLNQNLSKEEVAERLDELLKLERLA